MVEVSGVRVSANRVPGPDSTILDVLERGSPCQRRNNPLMIEYFSCKYQMLQRLVDKVSLPELSSWLVFLKVAGIVYSPIYFMVRDVTLRCFPSVLCGVPNLTLGFIILLGMSSSIQFYINCMFICSHQNILSTAGRNPPL